MRMVGGSGYGVGRLLRNLGIGSIRPKSLLLYQPRSCRRIVLCFISNSSGCQNGTNVLASSGTVVPPLYQVSFKVGVQSSQLTVTRTTRFPSICFHLSTKALTRPTRSSSPTGGFCVWKYDSVLKGVDGIVAGYESRSFNAELTSGILGGGRYAEL